MSNFKEFRDLISKRIDYIISKSEKLYRVNLKSDFLWDSYMDSFPPGTNEIHKERRSFDCNCCKQFIRPYAGLVAIIDGKKESIWKVDAEGFYQDVADYMNFLVLGANIKEVFIPEYKKLGTDKSDSAVGERWYHFYYSLPEKLLNKTRRSAASIVGEYNNNYSVFKRALEEFKPETLELVIDLIEQGSVERGQEFLGLVKSFTEELNSYNSLSTSEEKDLYVWDKVVKLSGAILSIRSSSIGTLIQDLNEGKDIEASIVSHGKKVSGANYKRPKNTIITKKMYSDAVETLTKEGLLESLDRRYAVESDISINDVLYADKSVKLKKSTGNSVLDLMGEEIEKRGINTKKLENLKETSLETFMEEIIPESDSIELLLENSHINNLASITSSKIEDSKNLFKWNNNKAWTYNKGVADSIKEQVSELGGNVKGVIRYSIKWFNNDDYDAHCIEPSGNRIYYSSTKNPRTTGELDVDIITPADRNFKGIVENITWTDINKMEEGDYEFLVHNYTERPDQGRKHGFIAEIEYKGKVWTFEYFNKIPNDKYVSVATINFNKKSGVTIKKSLPEGSAPKNVWNIKTQEFHRVKMIMNSPNYWKSVSNPTGNKHTFFILDKCINKDLNPRVFYNEFLKEDLNSYRKFFEILGSKLKLEEESEQLSGVGFSSSRKGTLTFRVNTRKLKNKLIKVNF